MNNKYQKISIAVALLGCFAGNVIAQSKPPSSEPPQSHAQPGAPVMPMPQPMAAQNAQNENIDALLDKISRNMKPPTDLIDSQSETSINREIGLSRSTGQLLRPIGFMEINDDRVVFASEDGIRVLSLRENSKIGVMKVLKISESGVSYSIGGKTMFAPLAYMATEAPKAAITVSVPSPSPTPQAPSPPPGSGR